MLVGYARVSSQDQNLELQQDALREAGCERIFTDKASGTTTSRPGLDRMLGELRDGDAFVVWKLDRVGRSVRHLVEFTEDLRDQGVEFGV